MVNIAGGTVMRAGRPRTRRSCGRDARAPGTQVAQSLCISPDRPGEASETGAPLRGRPQQVAYCVVNIAGGTVM
ncbi:MAG: hypothetical protein J7479_18925, partial [Roseiflexus sp.]|nr:hypothetical protein [Roseiflexus sp.]